MAKLLADSYALIELFGGNPRYVPVFRAEDVATTALNVVEVYSALLRRLPQEEAETYARACLARVVDVPSTAALRAAEFRTEMHDRKRNCSHVDAWGYAAAEVLGRKFLTGDEAFHGLSNVQFVK